MIDPAKLKVVELRAELAKRGLDQKGNKPVLVARLQEAIDEEEEEEEEEEVPEEELLADTPTDEPIVQEENPLLQDEVSAQSAQSSEAGNVQQEEDSSLFPSQQDESESKQESEVIEQDPIETEQVTETKQTEIEDFSGDSTSQQQSEDQPEESMDTWQQQNQGEEESESSYQPPDHSFHIEDSNAQDVMDTDNKYYKEEPEKSQSELEEKPAVVEEKPAVTDEKPEIKVDTEQVKEESVEVKEEVQTENKVSVNDIKPLLPELATERRERKNRWDDGVSTKRKRSPSPDRSYQPKRVENEPEIDDNAVTLSWYDSDLNLEIDTKSFTSAAPMTQGGFGHVWAGSRASYGFEQGKIYYEVKVTEDIEVKDLEDEPTPNVVRVGWSVLSNSLQLGEDPLSYGYGGTGKISTNCKFDDYGKPFVVNDIIGCYINLDSDPIEISYTINGEEQGVAFRVSTENVKGKPLFPHVLTKNCKYLVNFGQEEPWSTNILSGYTSVGKVELEKRIAGPKRPEKREDCEAIMLIGLPACGKTTWAVQYAADNKDKLYNVLGTNSLIDKMKVMGLPRKRNYRGRWEGLIQKCTRCLNKLLDVSCTRRRNYIIDQTNVYPSAQRRKMRGFEGFNRRAVVIVPTDEELKNRTSKREAEEGKDVPDTAVLEMKANFGLPEKGDIFNEVTYIEVQEEEAKQLITQYNKEGADAGFAPTPPSKRFRPDDRGGQRRDNRDYRGGGGNWRDRGYNNNNRYNDRGWGGPQRGPGGNRGGGGGGGWRDRYPSGGGGGGGWRGSSGGGGGGGGRYNGSRDRDDRSRDRRDVKSGSGRHGGSGGSGSSSGGDRNDKRQPSRNDNQSWNNQQNQMSNYGQSGWGQYNQGWGNWGQGYNQSQQQGQAQQWKGYPQQNWGQQQQQWGQQGWGQWNQQYYNQAYQQGWGQTAIGTNNSTTSSTGTGQSSTGYGTYGQGAGAGQNAAWGAYNTTNTNYTGTGTASTTHQTAVTYTPTQKQ